MKIFKYFTTQKKVKIFFIFYFSIILLSQSVMSQNSILDNFNAESFFSLNQNENNNPFNYDNQFDQDETIFSLPDQSFQSFKQNLEFLEFLKLKRDNRKLTKLEESYKDRSGTRLKLQGYDLFDPMNMFYAQSNQNYFWSIQDDYILGPGDEIFVTLQGSKTRKYLETIDRNGNLIFDFTPPISASGRKYADVKNEILTKVKNAFLETDAIVSLSNVKDVSIMVSGHVEYPSIYQLNALSSILEVLVRAGGIKHTGSLRNIKIINQI